MRHLRFLFCLLSFVALAPLARAESPWNVLPPTPSLPKAAHSGYAPVNGIKIWYAVFGHGQPVILLHGGLGNSNYWGNQVPVLARHYQVIVMDSRGHGRSTRDDQPYGYDLMASDVIGLMDFLKIQKAAVVGWSDGAILGLDIAIHHPERLTKLFAFAANSMLCRLALQQGLIDPASFATIRLVAGAIKLAVIVRLRSDRSAPGHADWLVAAMLFADVTFFSFAYLTLPAGTGALILFCAVQVTMFSVGLRTRRWRREAATPPARVASAPHSSGLAQPSRGWQDAANDLRDKVSELADLIDQSEK